MPVTTDQPTSSGATPQKTGPVVFISAAEPSADLHGSKLIRAVREQDPSVRFVGIAGPLMREAGCEVVFDMTSHAAMLAGVFKVAPHAWEMLKRSKAYLRSNPVDLAVVIDSPTLNLPVAKYARRNRVPVLYYIAPQVWAWGKVRVYRVRRRTNRLGVILPFEEAFFRRYGIQADYVGHPLFDTLAQRVISDCDVAAVRAKGSPLITILPGSRKHVVDEVFGGQLEVADAILEQHPDAHFAISVANERTLPIVEEALAKTNIPYSLHRDANGVLMSASDLALVASGTASLETAYYHLPMIVMYNTTRLGWYALGKWAVCTKHLSLVNILADREIVPEFMPFYRSTEPIKRAALDLLGNPERLAAKRQELADLMNPMIKTGASQNAAAIVLEMLKAAGK
ncbi:MAG: lipid-A-disaccharide synthase [Phycisphaerales bacterium]|nr:lipid-A-disaccharide synthase [Phycisphaerales bacterium]